MSEKTTTSPETYDFLQILTLGSEALLRAQVLIRSKSIHGQTKEWIRTSIINRLKAMNSDLTSFLPAAEREIIKSQAMDPEVVLQMEVIRNGVMDLTTEDRGKVELYIEQLKMVIS